MFWWKNRSDQLLHGFHKISEGLLQYLELKRYSQILWLVSWAIIDRSRLSGTSYGFLIGLRSENFGGKTFVTILKAFPNKKEASAIRKYRQCLGRWSVYMNAQMPGFPAGHWPGYLLYLVFFSWCILGSCLPQVLLPIVGASGGGFTLCLIYPWHAP